MTPENHRKNCQKGRGAKTLIRLRKRKWKKRENEKERRNQRIQRNQRLFAGLQMTRTISWTNSISIFVLKTNHQFAHYQKLLDQPYFANWWYFLHRCWPREVWSIKNWKIALACLFFVVDVLIWCLSQQTSVKKAFLSRTERFGSFSFCFFYSNLGLPSAKSLKNERLVSCPPGEKSSR